MPIALLNPPFHAISRFLLTGLLLLAILLATGCAGIASQQSGEAPSPEPTSARTYHDAIDITGRLSIRYEQNGREESLHGSFNWNQQPQRVLLTLFSPLGQTVATIENTQSTATLLQAGQPPRTAADADTLVADTLGWPLPVTGLRDWLQGFASRSDASRFIAMPGDAGSFVTTRDGWQLGYPSWNQNATPAHPRRIDLRRNTVQAGQVEIRLVIDTWQPAQ